MKYFLISQEVTYTDVPRIINWYEKINPKWINKDEAYRLPSRELLFIGLQDRVTYTDILTKPFFLMSTMVRDVTRMYDPLIDMKEIILLDAERRKSKLYFLPILEEVECLEETFGLKRKTRDISLDYDKVKDKFVFIAKGNKSRYIVGNLEWVESLLKRGATGVGLQEIAYRIR